MNAPSIFVSYSHHDEKWLDRLVTHLGVIHHQELIAIWTDRRIEAGTDWYDTIDAALSAAKVAILLVTPNFLDSQFIRTEEIPRLLQRRSTEGLDVVPVVVKPCAWELAPWLKQMQLRPKDAHPLSSGQEHQIDQDLADITREIYHMLFRERATAGAPLGDADARSRAPMRPLREGETLPPEISADVSSVNIALVADALEVAGLWFSALRSGDFVTVWILSDDNWRLCRAQAWIWNNRQLLGLTDSRASNRIAEELSAVHSAHPLWPEFARIERNQFMELFSAAPTEQWGVASRRRSVGPGYELVLFTSLREHVHGYVVTEPTAIEAQYVLMHLVADGWRVGAYGTSAPPQPGWPPAWWIHDSVAAAATDQMLVDRRNDGN